MKWVESAHVNRQDWDELVQRSKGTVFSLAAYLDATAENWGVLYNDARTGGIICPYTVKLGVKVLYAPFFHRYTEWIGEDVPEWNVLLRELQNRFPVADAQLRFEAYISSDQRVHQVVTADSFHPNQQAKRMLKKAVGYTVESGRRDDELLLLLQKELTPRIATINDHSLQLLGKLVKLFDEEQLQQLNLFENGAWKGAIWLLHFNDRTIYLKGTVEPEAKNKGGMYLLMQQAIQETIEKGGLFDFGGSNADGVRRFNLNWGAYDVSYHALQWNNAPLWWKWIKTLRQRWNNK